MEPQIQIMANYTLHSMAHPSQTPHPNANDDYIDKEFIGKNITQITDSTTRQISGCKFININVNEILFYNNRIEYSEASTSHAAPLFLTTGIHNSMTISQCTFVNCVGRDGDGNAINCRSSIALLIKESKFVNCYCENPGKSNPAIVRFNPYSEEGIGSVAFTDCTFMFSVDTQSCPALYGSCPDVTFERCLFSKCGATNLVCKVRNFQFIDNTVFQSSQQAISISKVTGKVNITGSSFNFNTIASSSLVVLNSATDDSDVSINNCNFTDCKCSGENVFTVQVSAKKAVIEYCDFYFELNDENSANGAIHSQGNGFTCKYCTFTKTRSNGAITVAQTESQTDSVTVSNCIFDDCAGSNTRCFNLITYTDKLTFSYNVVQNMKANGANSYFGLLKPNNKVESLEMLNISFIDNTCNTEYGGGIGLLIEDVKEVYFNDCKFINNVATSSQRSQNPSGMTSYTSGDGGAFQYGFEKSIYEINLKFDHCLFSRNKASRHGGALAIQTVGTVEITFCTFEENEANYKVEPSSLNLLDNYFNLKAEGRGGAIYINPSFEYENHDHTTKYLKSISITNCTFTSNSAFDGFAIYIEGDDRGTKFNIEDNKFINNNNTIYSENQGVIVTEIDKFCNDIYIVDTSNTFTNQFGLNISKVSCVNHSAMPTIYYKDFDTCDPRCYASEETPEIPRFYVIKDYNFNNKENTEQDGGSAVHLENCGVSIIKSNFVECISLNHCGGAIYIDNNVLLKNVVNIEAARFTSCKSSYGGAIYIHSTSEESPVKITECVFTNNVATKTEGDLVGGSAIYLNAIRAQVIRCMFKANTGVGGSVKVVNDFDSGSESKILNLNRNLVLVSDSIFEIVSRPKSSSIFYQVGKFGSNLEVKNCIFKGKLGLDSFHIDGKKMVKNSPLVYIKNCKFTSDLKSSLNIKENFIDVNLKEQVFNYENEKSDSVRFSLLTVVAAALLAVIALGLVIVAIIVIKRKNTEKNNDEEVIFEPLQII